MKKIQHRQLGIFCVCIVIVCLTLYAMYDLFAFHAYIDVIDYDTLASANNDDITIDKYELFQDASVSLYGNATVSFKDVDSLLHKYPSLQRGMTLPATMQVTYQMDSGKEKVVTHDYTLILDDAPCKLEPKKVASKGHKYAGIKEVTLKVHYPDQEVSYPLHLETMKPMKSMAKKYHMQAISISKNTLRLGKLIASYSMKRSYDTISLEYRYINDPGGRLDDMTNYTVFNTVTMSLYEYMKSDGLDTFVYDGKGTLEDKNLSVVVLLEKGTKRLSIPFDLSFDGGQYGQSK